MSKADRFVSSAQSEISYTPNGLPIGWLKKKKKITWASPLDCQINSCLLPAIITRLRTFQYGNSWDKIETRKITEIVPMMNMLIPWP